MSPGFTRDELPYDPNNPSSILARAAQLTGRASLDVASEVGFEEMRTAETHLQNKGVIGHCVEAFFFLEPNSEGEADFPCGLELKVLPVKQLKSGSHPFNAKERTILGLINYNELIDQEWETAKVRDKLDKIIFVPYLYDPDPRKCIFQGAFIWRPPEVDLPQLEKDWRATRDAVRAGQAHELSESIGKLMGPARKGGTTTQPCSEIPARRRAFALKASYTYQQVVAHLGEVRFESAAETLGLSERLPGDRTSLEAVEAELLGRLQEMEGERIRDLVEARRLKVGGGGKSLAARMVNQVVGIGETGAYVEELAKEGVRIKTLHAREPGTSERGADLYPFESMSFPAVDLLGLAQESWEETDLQQMLQRLLIIPTLSDGRRTRQVDRKVGRAFFWSPTPAQWRTIEEEWREVKDLVNEGATVYEPLTDDAGEVLRDSSGNVRRRNRMPGSKDTEIIHMRPHGADASDTVPEPGGDETTRQCFWLNASFLHRLLEAVYEDGERAEEVGVFTIQ